MKKIVSSGNINVIIKGFFLFILIFFASGKLLLAQMTIQGIVINKASGDPVENVFISWDQDKTTLTNRLGEFAVRVERFPAKIAFSHVSYGVTEITLERSPAYPFYVRLEEKVSEIDEVQVTGERLRILTKDDDFSLMDFAFDKHHMWMLGHINNQANRQTLFLCTSYGDTISTMPVRRGERLYRDPFDNVHLLSRDTAFQLFSRGDSIEILYRTPRELFDETMQGILCGFNGKLVYKDFNPFQFYARLYYLCAEDSFQHHLMMVIDSLGKDADWQSSKMGPDMWETLRSGSKPGTKIASMVKPPIPIDLFTYGDSLFVLNYFKDSLLCYSPDGKFVRSVLVDDFHKEEKLLGIDYRELEFIADHVTNKVYITDRKIAKWKIHSFNTSSGKPGPEIMLPDFAGMTGIKANNDAIYFLYHEKLHPYYTRLYRYQL